MEIIQGRQSRKMHKLELDGLIEGYTKVSLDLGTGDGRFVSRMADQFRDRLFIGIDSCRENLRVNSRKDAPNALFVIAGAQSLPGELTGLASHISINFPWGSLLGSLLNNDPCLIEALCAITRPCARMELYLNADALGTAGWRLDSGADQIENVLNAAGWKTKSHAQLEAQDLHTIPTTWAKRLAFGRDPRAIRLCFEK